jgi:drug/metabolite transporter (DMT)-like permease
MLHMGACSLLTYAAIASGLVPARRVQSRAQLHKIAVLAAIFTATLVLGNISLRFIPVSFNQAVGACTPFFTALFGFYFAGIRERASTYAALVPVVLGVTISAGFEPQLHMLGFLACLLATALRALKTVLQVSASQMFLTCLRC